MCTLHYDKNLLNEFTKDRIPAYDIDLYIKLYETELLNIFQNKISDNIELGLDNIQVYPDFTVYGNTTNNFTSVQNGQFYLGDSTGYFFSKIYLEDEINNLSFNLTVNSTGICSIYYYDTFPFSITLLGINDNVITSLNLSNPGVGSYYNTSGISTLNDVPKGFYIVMVTFNDITCGGSGTSIRVSLETEVSSEWNFNQNLFINYNGINYWIENNKVMVKDTFSEIINEIIFSVSNVKISHIFIDSDNENLVIFGNKRGGFCDVYVEVREIIDLSIVYSENNGTFSNSSCSVINSIKEVLFYDGTFDAILLDGSDLVFTFNGITALSQNKIHSVFYSPLIRINGDIQYLEGIFNNFSGNKIHLPTTGINGSTISWISSNYELLNLYNGNIFIDSVDPILIEIQAEFNFEGNKITHIFSFYLNHPNIDQ